MIDLLRVLDKLVHRRSLVTPWPKQLPVLTSKQLMIREDFMKHWLEVLPTKYGFIERINHWYAIPQCTINYCKTLEVGGGIGAHLAYEDLTSQEYTVLELREELAHLIRLKYPNVRVIVGDVQERIAAPEEYFDRIIAVHVLEHLPNLQMGLSEIRRVMKPSGIFSVVIPCEGGVAYELIREVALGRLFEERYACSYDWLVRSEHLNDAWELLGELKQYFNVSKKSYWPLRIPSIHLNLVIGLTCVPKS